MIVTAEVSGGGARWFSLPAMDSLAPRQAAKAVQMIPDPAMSRREALSAGLVVAGAAGLAPALLSAASSPSPASAPSAKIVFGADRSGYDGLHSATPLAVGLRWYLKDENELPSAWPDIHPSTHMTLSLRPNPADLLSGKLDRRLKAIIDSAPPNSELTFWHENTTGNPLRYPHYVNNARAAISMQKYGKKLCAGSKVRFGVITVGPVIGQTHWIARGLDWYGDDLYEWPKLRGPHNSFDATKVIARLNQNLAAWRKASGQRRPAVRICETNSPYDSHRAEFFATIAQWLAGHNGNRMLTYWNPRGSLANGGVSGPWPPSKPVIRRLTSLAEHYDWKKR
ncbi:MAG: hypothetical protein ACR2FU_04115 [Streptosporangiaceae bacterium]